MRVVLTLLVTPEGPATDTMMNKVVPTIFTIVMVSMFMGISTRVGIFSRWIIGMIPLLVTMIRGMEISIQMESMEWWKAVEIIINMTKIVKKWWITEL